MSTIAIVVIVALVAVLAAAALGHQAQARRDLERRLRVEREVQRPRRRDPAARLEESG